MIEMISKYFHRIYFHVRVPQLHFHCPGVFSDHWFLSLIVMYVALIHGLFMSICSIYTLLLLTRISALLWGILMTVEKISLIWSEANLFSLNLFGAKPNFWMGDKDKIYLAKMPNKKREEFPKLRNYSIIYCFPKYITYYYYYQNWRTKEIFVRITLN